MGLPAYNAPLWKRINHKEAIQNALELTGTKAIAATDYRNLSGGQQQRVRLARTLVASPRLLLLDEPAAALDSQGKDQLYTLLRRLCDEQNVAVIMVEHDIAAISAYVDSVACLNTRIHHHAMRGESVPEHVWHAMYGEHMHVVAHDAHCIGCDGDNPS
jgi:zinc transport system ATP-binding protein